MTLTELRQSPHLSASGISDYLDCGLLYRFGKIDKLKPEFKPESLEFGTVMHLVMAEIHQAEMIGEELSIKAIHESFENHWTKIAKDRTDIKYAEGKSFESCLLEGKELLNTFHHKKPQNDYQIVGVEEPFIFHLPGLPIPIIGAMDLLEEDESGVLIISDLKTASRAYSLDEVDRNFQMTLYQIAAKANGYADKEIILRFDCLVKTKTPKFEQYYTTRSELDERKAVRKIIEVYKGIEAEVFIPNDSPSNWKCKGCSYKKSCEAWFLQEAA